MRQKDLKISTALVPVKTKEQAKEKQGKAKKPYKIFGLFLFFVSVLWFFIVTTICLTDTYNAFLQGFSDNNFGKAAWAIFWAIIDCLIFLSPYNLFYPHLTVSQCHRKYVAFIENGYFFLDEIQNMVLIVCTCAFLIVFCLFLGNHFIAAFV